MIWGRWRRGGRVRGQRAESAILPLRGNGRIFARRHENDIVEFKRLQIDRFLNQVAVLVADMLKLCRRHTHVKRATRRMTVARGLEPRLIRLADDLFFEGPENLEPGIKCRSRRNSEYHRPSPCLRRLCMAVTVHLPGLGNGSLHNEAYAHCRVAYQKLPGRRV